MSENLCQSCGRWSTLVEFNKISVCGKCLKNVIVGLALAVKNGASNAVVGGV